MVGVGVRVLKEFPTFHCKAICLNSSSDGDGGSPGSLLAALSQLRPPCASPPCCATPCKCAAAAFLRFPNRGLLLNSSSNKCGGILRLRASSASEGRGELRARVHVEGVTLGLSLYLEVAKNNSRYLHVMASSMHNVDNGENHAFNSCPGLKNLS